MKILRRLVPILTITACLGDPVGPGVRSVATESASVDTQIRVLIDTPAVLRLGDTLPIRVAAIDAHGNVFPAPDVVLSVVDSSVVSVLGSGIIGGPRRGQSLVRVASHGVEIAFSLRVTQYVTAIVPVSDVINLSALGAELPVVYVVRDDRGRIVADSAASISAADTGVVRVVGGQVRALAPGVTSLRLTIGQTAATIIAGVQQRVGSLRLVRDTIRLDALMDTTTVSPIVHDSLGSAITDPALEYHVSDRAVARFTGRTLEALMPGTAIVTVRDSVTGVSMSAPVVVQQRIIGLEVTSMSDTLNMLGATFQLSGRAVDRNGFTVPDGSLSWRAIDSALVDVSATGTSVARGVGVARIEVSSGEVLDTLRVVIRQIAASLSLDQSIDTLDLGQEVTLTASATDSNGFAIPDPHLAWESSDRTVADVDSAGRVIALQPGLAEIHASSGGGSAHAEVVVEGVALYVNGERWSQPGLLSPGDRVTITNGRVRLQRSEFPEQQAGIEADARIADTWYSATARRYGDWTYVATSVVTAPTRLEVLVTNGEEVAVRWTFGDHWFFPGAVNLSPDLPDAPYPFEKTVWLRRAEQGYYALINPLTQLPAEVTVAEHEVGFGGIYGAAELRTASVSMLTDTLSSTVYYNLDGAVDAVELLRRDDVLRRVLVPLGGAPLATPRFSSSEFGGTFVHSNVSGPYGAYLYIVPTHQGAPTNAICQRAWHEAPFAVPVVPAEALDRCGAQAP